MAARYRLRIAPKQKEVSNNEEAIKCLYRHKGFYWTKTESLLSLLSWTCNMVLELYSSGRFSSVCERLTLRE